MKRFMIVLAALAMMMSTVAFAQDGATLYKTKCAACHGAAGEGKMGPSLKTSKANIEDVVLKGGMKGPHAKPVNALTEEQAKSIATFVATLK